MCRFAQGFRDEYFLFLTRTIVCGKSSLMKLLLGEKIPYTGKLYLANNLKISYIPQDASFLSGDLKDFACAYGLDESLVFSTLSDHPDDSLAEALSFLMSLRSFLS